MNIKFSISVDLLSRDEIQVTIFNHGSDAWDVTRGSMLGQLLLRRSEIPQLEEVKVSRGQFHF
jgi:dUTPase